MTEPTAFIHRPTRVEAMRWDGTVASAADILAWYEGHGGKGHYYGPVTGGPYITLDTADGGAAGMTEGMWLVHGIEDRWYAITEAVHAQSYEAVGACWEDGPRTDEGPGGGSTCLLDDGHDGPHEFTSDRDIVVKFG